MKVLVTGGAGFIGSHTVDELLAQGHDVRILDSLEPPVHSGRRPDYVPSDAEFMSGDVTDRVALRRALQGVDAIFHFAAYQDYLTDFSRFFHTNSVGTALLYEIIVTERLAVQKIVVASSQAVYGEGAHLCPVHGLTHPGSRSPAQLDLRDWAIRCSICGGPTEPTWTSEAVAKPHNSYGLSKRDQEDVALVLGRRYAIPSVALRYSIVQGPRQSFQNAYSGALRAFAVRALTGGSPVLFEDGEQLRDYVSVQDVVRANLLVLEDERAVGQVFNVGGDRKVSVRELADLVVRGAGSSVPPVAPGVFRVGDTRHIFSDVSRLKAMGWEPLVDQTAMVNEYLAWASDQPDLSDTFEPAQTRMRELGVLRTTH